jgi:hypothetical protein
MLEVNGAFTGEKLKCGAHKMRRLGKLGSNLELLQVAESCCLRVFPSRKLLPTKRDDRRKHLNNGQELNVFRGHDIGIVA